MMNLPHVVIFSGEEISPEKGLIFSGRASIQFDIDSADRFTVYTGGFAHVYTKIKTVAIEDRRLTFHGLTPMGSGMGKSPELVTIIAQY
jgi:hypothetical protein